jgi:hypothetical protein
VHLDGAPKKRSKGEDGLGFLESHYFVLFVHFLRRNADQFLRDSLEVEFGVEDYVFDMLVA